VLGLVLVVGLESGSLDVTTGTMISARDDIGHTQDHIGHTRYPSILAIPYWSDHHYWII